MENRLARFLFTPYGSVASDVSPAVSSIQGLANAVIEINGLFIESRILLRSHVISIHAPSFPGGKINSVRTVPLLPPAGCRWVHTEC